MNAAVDHFKIGGGGHLEVGQQVDLLHPRAIDRCRCVKSHYVSRAVTVGVHLGKAFKDAHRLFKRAFGGLVLLSYYMQEGEVVK